jgi:hypothetical protein
MDKHQAVWNEKVVKTIIERFEKRGLEGSYAPNAGQAVAEVLEMIPQGASVYRCGSESTHSIGLWEKIAAIPGVEVIDPFQPGLSGEENIETRRRGMVADIMIASSNAVTLDGRLVNLDGLGNRVAAMMFGPRKVILVVGMNKIVPDLDSAIARVKPYAAPVNALRIGHKTPCTVNGLCADCKTQERICNMWTIIEGHRLKGRIHVKLVGEDLGY